MTVNERLFARGLIDRWDAAARGRKREEMISVLSQVALTKEDAASTVDAVLADPAKYGF